METSALLANIGIILAKDLLADEKSTQKDTPQLFSFYLDDLDESSNEAETFFLQEKYKKTNDPKKHETKVKDDVNLLSLFDFKDFNRNLHMEQATFLQIFNKISTLLSKCCSPTAMTMFSLAIWKLSTDEHFEQIARRFNVPSQISRAKNLNLFEVHNAIREFWRLISQNSKIFIDFPFRSEHMQPNILACSQANSEFRRLPGMCAIIALKQLDVFLESSDEEVQIIWQIIFNANGTILDCFVELTSNYSFESTPICRILEAKGGIKPSSGYLIGDNNFPLRSYLICPYKMPENESQRAFNSIIESALVSATSIWDKMAKRFNALYALESKDLYEVRRIISTICVLHNICTEIGDNFVDQEKQNKNWSTFSSLSLSGIALPTQAAIDRRNKLCRDVVEI